MVFFGCPVGTTPRLGAVLFTSLFPQAVRSTKTYAGTLVLTAVVTSGAAVLPAAPAQAAPVSAPSVNRQSSGVVPAKSAATKKLSKAQKQAVKAKRAVKFTYKQIGDPYRYGATGPGSWDCSGLAGTAWRKSGVKLPRTTTQIYRAVRKKVARKNLRAGDLVFFYSGRGHMGVYVGKGYMVHAPSSGKRVQKVKLKGYYVRNMNGAVRPGI